MRWNRFWILGGGTLFICTLFIQAQNLPLAVKHDSPLKTIVIDPGHGGADIGARGSYSTEKEISLEVALKLGKMMEERMPDVKVVYTRKTDRYDDPRKKAEIANNARGDLFISIHCNSAPRSRKVVGYRTVYRKRGGRKVRVRQPIYKYYPSTAKGTETYVWATSKNDEKTESLKESSVMVLDANSEEAKEVMDAADPETFIMLNTLRNAFFDQSLRLSTLVEDEFTKVGRISRGPRQRNEKGIWVLQATAMPSVLVELGFISNPEEEKYLNSASGQEETALCIFNAVKRYKEELERFGNFKKEAAPPPPPAIPEPVMQPVIETGYKQPAAAPAGVTYKVQLLVSDKDYTPESSIFRKLDGPVQQEPVILNSKRFNKYIWGNFKTEPEAGAAVQKARQLGFHDAFVVPYKDGLRLEAQM